MLTFLKAQASSVVASGFDFLITILLVELAGVHALPASIEGSVFGGIINFFVNRLWVFTGNQHKTQVQMARYALVWVGSMILNASGYYLLIHFTSLYYVLSKLLVSILVGVLFNYFLQKRFVFK